MSKPTPGVPSFVRERVEATTRFELVHSGFAVRTNHAHPLTVTLTGAPRDTTTDISSAAVLLSPGRHKCSNCITVIPADKPSGLCWFCEKTQDLAAQIGTRQCLRCQKVKPEDSFAGRTNKYRVCDDCRWSYPMTDDEKRRSHQMSPYYGLRRRRRREAYLRKAA